MTASRHVVFNNNTWTFGTRPSRNVIRRRNNRMHRRKASVNNEDVLNRISTLPRQSVLNELLINEFFNGSTVFI